MRLLPLIHLIAGSIACIAQSVPKVRDGDLIFQTSRSSQSVAIQKATQSPYSHMGIVFSRGGKPYVFEAISRVKFTPLAQWVSRGQGGHYVVKRLRMADSLLTPQNMQKLRVEASNFEGRPYDLTFEWSDQRIYCSELVWKIYKKALGLEVGHLQKLREFNLEAPAVRSKLRERYGSRIPFDEPVISPKAMFESEILETVSKQ